MINTRNKFYGQQEDERILYTIQSHPIALTLNLIKLYSVALVIVIAFVLIGNQFASTGAGFTFVGVLLAVVIIVVGSKIVHMSYKRNMTYITDRRIVRFEPTNIFATNIRTLTWDEVVKVKTYPPNFVWKMFAIGNVVIHARTTVRVADEVNAAAVTADDIEISHVYYYRDLGNYIDKILFTYKRKPTDIDQIKPFVAKPKGQRD